MTDFEVHRPHQDRSSFAIGRISGNLYLRVSGLASHVPWGAKHKVIVLALGSKANTDLQLGQITEQEDHQLDWLPQGTIINLKL